MPYLLTCLYSFTSLNHALRSCIYTDTHRWNKVAITQLLCSLTLISHYAAGILNLKDKPTLGETADASEIRDSRSNTGSNIRDPTSEIQHPKSDIRYPTTVIKPTVCNRPYKAQQVRQTALSSTSIGGSQHFNLSTLFHYVRC